MGDLVYEPSAGALNGELPVRLAADFESVASDVAAVLRSLG
jgi:hypothetical protein